MHRLHSELHDKKTRDTLEYLAARNLPRSLEHHKQLLAQGAKIQVQKELLTRISDPEAQRESATSGVVFAALSLRTQTAEPIRTPIDTTDPAFSLKSSFPENTPNLSLKSSMPANTPDPDDQMIADIKGKLGVLRAARYVAKTAASPVR